MLIGARAHVMHGGSNLITGIVHLVWLKLGEVDDGVGWTENGHVALPLNTDSKSNIFFALSG